MNDVESILNKILSQWGLPGVIICYLMWDRYQDWKKDKEVTVKKQNGTYKSWESMDERINSVEKRVDEHDKADQTAFEEVRIKKAIQDEKNTHFTETLIRLDKGQDDIVTKIEKGNDNIYQLISEIKTFLMNLKK